MRRMLLIGGGHAHLAVLKALAAGHHPGVEAVMITPSPLQTYSGMLPGWVAGHYALEACRINLRPLAEAAGAVLISQSVGGLDADRRCVALADGRRMEYDVLSLDIGSETDLSWLGAAGERVLSVRPVDAFVTKWEATRAQALRQCDYRIAVVGGGAAGVELALAIKYRLGRDGADAMVTLVASESGLLPGHAPSVTRRVERLMTQCGIQVHYGRAAGAAEGLLFADGSRLQVDAIIAATGAQAAGWLRLSRLALNEHGYVMVSADHRCVSHGNVFAAGDVCCRVDTPMARSGVHAVHAGPVIAHNLLVAFEGGDSKPYRPRRNSLYLLAAGSKFAIASWGRWSAEGAWVWRWKDWIDRRFIARHTLGKQP